MTNVQNVIVINL